MSSDDKSELDDACALLSNYQETVKDGMVKVISREQAL